MGSTMLIDATHPEETRVVVVRGNRIEEFDFESAARKQLKGNIYLAKVTRVEPSLQAAFVEYGGNRHGFLAFSEIHPDYYQIPLADRQALLREQAEEDDHDDDGEHARHARHDDLGRAEEHTAPAAGAGEEAETPPAAMALERADEGESLSTEPSGVIDAAPEAKHGLPAEIGNGIEVVEEDVESQGVDSLGAEDALEEVPRRTRRPPRRQYKIQEVIKRRQVILVQVVKEERGTKGAALTTYLSLAGRYCVLMPNTARGGGISRKITDSGDRRRLKDVAREIEVPDGMGLIVRTAGAQRTKTEIKRDYDYLLRLWESVRDLTLSSTAPALVYEEGSLIKRAIRDLYSKDVDEIHVEGEGAYREAKDFMKMLMPSHAKNVKLYKDARPLFSRYQVESQLDALYSPTVTLPSGGYVVINQTEALVSIDVNSGKATREHNIEDTALKTNLEASDEVARQLRLRDLAGLIVIDFIDMEEKRNNRSVERRLKEALKNDRARIQVGRISHFGLLEMSRQRLRPGLLEGSSRTCPHCEGRGVVRSISSCGLSVLRAIEEHLINRRAENLTARCSTEVASYILNEKRDHLIAIEQAYGISVFVVASNDIRGSHAVIERAGERQVAVRKVQAAPIKIDSAFGTEPEASEDEAAPEPAEDEAPERHGEEQAGRDESEGGGRRRRRRRGRRGGRRGREEMHDQPRMVENGDFETSPETGPDALEPLEGSDEDAAESAENVTPPMDMGHPEARGERERPPENGERQRFGGGRGRGRHRSRKEPAEESRSDMPREESFRELAAPEAQASEIAAIPAAPEESLPDAAAEQAHEARKWQPPAPTVSPAATERKAGWWSRRS